MRAVLLCLAIVPIAAAQSLVVGPEQPLEFKLQREQSYGVTLASNGRDFAAIWRNPSHHIVSTFIDANGQPRTEFPSSLTDAASSAIASNGRTYVAVWGLPEPGEIVSVRVRDDRTVAPVRIIFQQQNLQNWTVALGATSRDYLVTWAAAANGTWQLRAAVLDGDGSRRGAIINIDEGVGTQLASIAGVGSNFLVVYRTQKAIKIALVDPDRSAVIARFSVAAANFEMPIVVKTRQSAMVFFSNGTATFAVPLTAAGEPIDEPIFVARGTLRAATSTDGSPVIAVHDDRIALYQIPQALSLGRLPRRIAVLPPEMYDVSAMSWNGTNILIAAQSQYTDLVLAGLDGTLSRSAPLAFVESAYPQPAGIVSAGGIDLVLWTREDDPFFYGTYFSRFENGHPLDDGFRIASNAEMASDGTSTFLILENDSFQNTWARLLTTGGTLSAKLPLGRGSATAAIWDEQSQEFIVFWVEELSRNLDEHLCGTVDSVIRAARVRRDGVVIAPADGAILATGNAIDKALAVPTASGFVLVWGIGYDQIKEYGFCHSKYHMHITAFSHAFTQIGELVPQFIRNDEEMYSLTIAGDGAHRVIVGLVAQVPEPSFAVDFRTLMVDDRAQLIWGAEYASLIGNGWGGSGFVVITQGGGQYPPMYAHLWKPDEKPSSLRALPGTTIDQPTPFGNEPYLAFAAGRTVGLYARPVLLSNGKKLPRMFTRTFTAIESRQSQ